MKNKLLNSFFLFVALMMSGCIIDDECLDSEIVAKFEEERRGQNDNDSSLDDNNSIVNNNGIKYTFVDLGLPSGTLWCTRNLDATLKEDYGVYLTWKDARNQIPKEMSMPSWEQARELVDYCSWRWTTVNFIYGYSGQGPNGNLIFLPAGGIFLDYSDVLKYEGDMGYFWIDYDTTTEYSQHLSAATILFMQSADVIPKISGATHASKINVRCVKK
ncbi:MAG: fibrobacter succinogenes major paralogous domain-containing protein [Muribaculaceae bacterium]|nr:fibrobacter succinogenes major paralogous domain-containing protein [Muribaculaceae bacterium]